MIQLTKLNDEVILLNEEQVKYIVFCPKIEVVLVNGDNCPVKEFRMCKNDGKGGNRL